MWRSGRYCDMKKRRLETKSTTPILRNSPPVFPAFFFFFVPPNSANFIGKNLKLSLLLSLFSLLQEETYFREASFTQPIDMNTIIFFGAIRPVRLHVSTLIYAAHTLHLILTTIAPNPNNGTCPEKAYLRAENHHGS